MDHAFYLKKYGRPKVELCILTLTLIPLKELQREGSTFPHTPDRLQVLVITTSLLGQGRDWVVSVEVLGQERGPVTLRGHQGSFDRCSINPSTEDIVSEVEWSGCVKERRE